jgi:hypothetical protein
MQRPSARAPAVRHAFVGIPSWGSLEPGAAPGGGRNARSAAGRAVFGRDRCAWRRARRSRCQRSTVSGRTSDRTRRSTARGSRCSRAARNARSLASNRTFSVPSCRFSTASWWRSARISTPLSRSLIGSRHRRANAFLTPRYASRNSTAEHHAVAITRCASTLDTRLAVESDTPVHRSSPGRMRFSAGAAFEDLVDDFVDGHGDQPADADDRDDGPRLRQRSTTLHCMSPRASVILPDMNSLSGRRAVHPRIGQVLCADATDPPPLIAGNGGSGGAGGQRWLRAVVSPSSSICSCGPRRRPSPAR